MNFPIRFDHDRPTLYWIDDYGGIYDPVVVPPIVDHDGQLTFDYPPGQGFEGETVSMKRQNDGVYTGTSTGGGKYRAVRAQTAEHAIITGSYSGEGGSEGGFVLVFKQT